MLQMSGNPEANKEFVEQLRMQELYDRKNEDGSDPYTYTDPEDGTVYDWDHEKKAWFPKVRALLRSVISKAICSSAFLQQLLDQI